MSSVKGFVVNALTSKVMAPLFQSFLGGRATVFMLHRFDDRDIGVQGHRPDDLRKGLEYLRRNGHIILPLSDLFARLRGEGPPLRGEISFTIDDGYSDQANIGARVFAEYDCPVTTFISTGFLDGQLWFWWDQIEYIFQEAKRKSMRIAVNGKAETFELDDMQARLSATVKLTASCKTLANEVKLDVIRQAAAAAEVDLPLSPPVKYAPMSWAHVRACEQSGMTFGPHTVTHPILSQVSDTQASWELTESWRRVQDETQSPVSVYCYPNGGWNDFGERETGLLASLGFQGAVVGEPGYARIQGGEIRRDGIYRVQRFELPSQLPYALQIVYGVERLKQVLRGEP